MLIKLLWMFGPKTNENEMQLCTVQGNQNILKTKHLKVSANLANSTFLAVLPVFLNTAKLV